MLKLERMKQKPVLFKLIKKILVLQNKTQKPLLRVFFQPFKEVLETSLETGLPYLKLPAAFYDWSIKLPLFETTEFIPKSK